MSNTKKDYFWNTLGTAANTFISLLLLIVVTRINGISDSGLFSLCFSFSIMFFTIGLFGGRIYQVSDVNGEFESRTYIFLKFITSAAMFITAVVFVAVNGYDRDRIFLLLSLVVYKILDAIADPLYGVMQRQGRLFFAGISMTLKAALGFAAFVAVDIATGSILLSSICLLAANALFIAAYDIPRMRGLEKIGNIFTGNIKPGMILLRASIYIFSFALLTNLLVNIPRYYVDAYHTASDLGFFGIVIMPATMLNLFVQFVIQPKLVPLSERFAAGEYAGFNRTVTKLILVSLGFGALAILATWLVGCPVMGWLYAKDFYPFRIGLTLVVLAGTINTVTMIYSNILSVMRRFKIQLFNYLVAVASVFAAGAAFIPGGSVDGAIMAFVAANAVQAALFLASYQLVYRRLRSRGLPAPIDTASADLALADSGLVDTALTDQASADTALTDQAQADKGYKGLK